jgi:hypothetical protein
VIGPWLVIGGWTAGPAWAERQPVALPALCARASLVVVAEATTVEGRWRAGEPGGIESVVTFAVTRTVRGRAPDWLSVVVPGGRVGRLTERVSEAAEFRTDARYLLLLTSDGSDWRLEGGVDGVVPVPWAEGAEAAAIGRLGACRA